MNLHIVSFDVPHPPDYGGVIDVFYKIKALSEHGIQIHLHCFEYGRKKSDELARYCSCVTYYKRKTGFAMQISRLPYIVKTRADKNLLSNLLKDDYPILFEGLHTTFFLSSPELKKRYKLVRCHNIEHDYYKGLSKNTTNIFRKIFFRLESARLKKYEGILSYADHILAVSPKDHDHFKHYTASDIVRLFHKNEKVSITEGKGEGILCHGNLSVPENFAACNFLVKKVFSSIDIPVTIAGKDPPPCIKEQIDDLKHISLIPDPDEITLSGLIRDARIHVLYTNQDSGFKLKLLNVLYNGRYCIVNDKMINSTSLGSACVICNTADEILTQIKQLYSGPGLNRKETMAYREEVLKNNSNTLNANIICRILGGKY